MMPRSRRGHRHFKKSQPLRLGVFAPLCALKYADLDAHADTPEVKARRDEVAAFEARMTELSKTACYTMRQLAVNGGDLMEAGLPAGPAVGATLQRLLTAVMEGRVLNERAALLEFALS